VISAGLSRIKLIKEMNKLDEGLGYAIALPLFLLLIPISISFVILYAILRDKKQSIVGSIIGFFGALVVAYAIPVPNGEGIIWLLMRIDIVNQSPLAPFIMAVFSGMLTAFIGLIVIKSGIMQMNRKTIAGIVIIVVASWILLNTYKQPPEEIQVPEPLQIPTLQTEPVPGPLSTKGYVYDDKLNYGFMYPDGWEFFINVDKDVEQCDPLRDYVNSNINCVDFPDENMKKVISFGKDAKIKLDGQDYESEVSARIEFTVKSATDLQDVETEFKRRLLGMPILNESTISINNISVYDILVGEDSGWKLRQTVFFANGTAYIFTYSSQDELYRMYEETFNNTINSFNIKER